MLLLLVGFFPSYFESLPISLVYSVEIFYLPNVNAESSGEGFSCLTSCVCS